MQLSDNSLATLLLCSDITGYGSKSTKRFTLTEWNKLADQIVNSDLKSPSALLHASDNEIQQALEINGETIDRIRQLLNQAMSLSLELEKLASRGIWVATRADTSYPIALKKVLKYKSPIYVFGSGNPENVNRSGIGIVGSRDVDNSGIEFTKRLAAKAVNENLSIISGGARGVDVTAEQEALQCGGKVISILHSKMQTAIQKKTIRHAIEAGQLTILSAVHPNAGFTGYRAMERNKYIYGLSKGTFIVSSAEGSGGTWSGVEENVKNGWVPTFIRSDEWAPAGNRALLARHEKSELVRPFHLDQSLTLVDLIKSSTPQSAATFNENNYDVYRLIEPLLKKVLKRAKSLDDLSSIFQVHKQQMKDWMARAIQESTSEVIELKDGVYILADEIPVKQQSFFDVEM